MWRSWRGFRYNILTADPEGSPNLEKYIDQMIEAYKENPKATADHTWFYEEASSGKYIFPNKILHLLYFVHCFVYNEIEAMDPQFEKKLYSSGFALLDFLKSEVVPICDNGVTLWDAQILGVGIER